MSLRIIIWDVQHGSAAFLETPNGTKIVKDLGVGSFGDQDELFSPLLHLKNKHGISRLDYVIISHPHKDHINDIMNFDRLDPRVLCRPKHLTSDDIMNSVRDEDKPLFEKYLEIGERYNQDVLDANNPTLPLNNGGVQIKNFIPTSCSRSNLNNHSVVSIFSYANSKIIISGDNEPASWKELLELDSFRKTIKDADIFVASHHGRESGYCPELFEHFKPRLTIISDDVETDTSATARYSNLSQGWTVHHRDGSSSEERKCVTTRSDGFIVIDFGTNSDGKNYISVKIA